MTRLPIKTEDTPHASGDPGNVILVVRKDTPATLAGTDGDYAPLQTDANGNLRVTVDAATSIAISALSPGTAAANLGKAEDAAHSSGDVGVMALGVRKDTPGAAVGADGDYAALQLDSTGNLRVVVSLGKAEDSASADGDIGVMALAVRNDAPSGLVGANGDYSALQVNQSGALYVQNKPQFYAKTYNASLVDAGTTKAGTNTLYGLSMTNGSAGVKYVKVYDKATAAASTDTPILKYAIAAGDSQYVNFPDGIQISSGISLRSVTENVDSGTTGAAANEVSCTILSAA